ncbi:MAG: DUF2384 domain-containing protein [Dechloromonas sp.]|nr:MAG: DUF2384 domain-containing protein [Dechloromonas sp.]
MNSLPMKTTKPISVHHRRLAAGLERQVGHLRRSILLLDRVDPEIYRAGRSLFSSDLGLALWLSEPARSLGGRVPLSIMRTKKGRAKVKDVLVALAHGLFV